MKIVQCLGALLLSATPAFAQQALGAPASVPPSWSDLAIQAQKNSTLDQITAQAFIAILQEENARLRGENSRLVNEASKKVPEEPRPK